MHKPGESLWDDDDVEDDVLIPSTRPVGGFSNDQSVADMRQQQLRILNDQDEGLDNLSKIISRQKQLAIRIGDEVEEQNGRTYILLIF